MASYPSSFIQELKDRVPLSDIVGRRVAWDRKKSVPAKRDFWGPCPFHGEKTASFHVNDPKGFYHCFGCGVHGDIFGFVMETENISFGEAIELVAEVGGIPLPPRIGETINNEQSDFRKRLLSVVHQSAELFSYALLRSSSGKNALTYLKEKRQLSDDIIQMFGLGYAPNGGALLSQALLKREFSLKEQEQSGMILSLDGGQAPYDRFRDRIMFPIHDAKGNVIAFGGRAMDNNAKAKYLNSPETPLFYKSKVLYNLHRAKAVAMDKKELIVCEGYMDVIALASAGWINAVAPLGTALTDDHILNLWKVTSVPTLCFDGDDAGRRAGNRSADRLLPLLKPDVSAKFLFLPDGLDPDDFLKQKGKDAFRALLESETVSLCDMIFNREAGAVPLTTPEACAGLEHRLEALANTIADTTVKAHYKRTFKDKCFWLFRQNNASSSKKSEKRGEKNDAKLSRTGQKSASSNPLFSTGLIKLNHRPSSHPPVASDGNIKTLPSERETVERLIIGMLIFYPPMIEQFFEECSRLNFKSDRLASLCQALLEYANSDFFSFEDKNSVAQMLDFRHKIPIHSQENSLTRYFKSHPLNQDFQCVVQEILENHRLPVFNQPMAVYEYEDYWKRIIFRHQQASLQEELLNAQKEMATHMTTENFERCRLLRQSLLEYDDDSSF